MTRTNEAINASEITFGVEIECFVKTTKWGSRPINSYHSRRPILLTGIEGAEGWKAETDTSLHTTLRGYTAIEIVSPILKGAEGIESVRAMLRFLNDEMDARVNRTCGLHVTVGFPTDNAAALRRLIHSAARHEKGIFASTGTHSRENGSYATKIKEAYDCLKGLRSISRVRSTSWGTGSNYADRYHWLNLTHMRSAKPRVEFRAFAGTTSGIKTIAAISLALGMVERAINSKSTPKWDLHEHDDNPWGMGRGKRSLFCLLLSLKWRVKKGTGAGVLTPELLPAIHAELMRLAEKYDAVEAAEHAERVRAARERRTAETSRDPIAEYWAGSISASATPAA